MKSIILTALAGMLSLSLFAQKGKVSGNIIDAETGEEMIGATVLVQGTSTGVVTDLFGNYQLELDEGTYTLSVSYVSYTTQIVENVVVTSDEVTKLDVALSTNVQLEEVVVTAEAINDNDVAILKLQKKALAVQDGISSAEIQKIGASNAAESMRQVTGATVEGGKYIVMRGLGDRYSLTQMNGVTLPSADPYRTSTSMDMIPADMIESIITSKTFTPDQPGNFTGGKVDVTTKSLPDKFYFNLGLKMGFNSQSSFVDNFKTDGAEGSLDWLGYDNIRQRPQELDTYYDYIRLGSAGTSAILGKREVNVNERTAVDKTARSLSNPFTTRTISTPMNYGANFSIGNQYQLFGRPLGINLGFDFDKSYTFIDNGTSGLFSDVGSEGLQVEQQYKVNQSDINTSLGSMLSLAYQLFPNHELKFNGMYSHDGQSAVEDAGGFWRETGTSRFNSAVTNFREREMINYQVIGNHYFDKSGIKVSWMGGYVKSTQDEPDVRMFGYTRDFNSEGNTSWGMNRSIVGILPSHFFRDLTDEQYNGKLDITIPIGKENNEIKIGGSYATKSREFNEYIYSFNNTDRKSYNHPDYISFSEANGDFDTFFSQDNVGLMGTFQQGTATVYGFGNIYSDQTQEKNSYTGEENIGGVYVMSVLELSEKIKTIVGARGEYTDMYAESKADGEERGEINKFDILPSFNLIYKLSESTNIRGAYSNTIARPNMREIAPFASIGGVGKDIVLGNADLSRTLIQNIDLRYETYPKNSELIAFSLYFKQFKDPIIWQLTPKASTPEIKPVNSENAIVAGAEFEYRKNLEFISPALRNFLLGFNASYIYSRVDKGEEELALLKSEQAQGRRLYIKDYRPFPGQSPYIINVRLNHNSMALNWENSVSFNIWGKRLSYVTSAVDPDVYEMPRPSLNFVSRKSINEHLGITLKAMNILNMKYKQVFDFPGTQEYIYENYQVGTTVSLGISYKL